MNVSSATSVDGLDTILSPVTISCPLLDSQVAVGVSVSPLMFLLTTHLSVYSVPASGGSGTVVVTAMLLAGTVESGKCICNRWCALTHRVT